MENTLELFVPFPTSTITQRFGDNANTSYSRDGLKGHTAFDWGAKYGEPGYACAQDSYVYSLMNKDNPDPSRYRAVFTIVETLNGVYELSYGHCSEIYAEVGKTYQAGDVLYAVGNTGDVFSGNHEVTKEERLAGSRAGTHAHCPQLRPLQKVKQKTGKQLIYDGNGVFRKDGYYYEVLDYGNGYNGCVSPEPFFNKVLAKDAKTVRSAYQQVIGLLQEYVSRLSVR